VQRRYQQTINGRTFVIEVAQVEPDRWRAYLVRLQEGPTALMPFYGPTPDDAARQLTTWLSLAHRPRTNPV